MNRDLISRAELLKAMEINIDDAPLYIKATVDQTIGEAPAVDAVPVWRGKWEEVEDSPGECHWKCSACGNEWYFEAGGPVENGSNYCPNCGAKMDGEEQDDELIL